MYQTTKLKIVRKLKYFANRRHAIDRSFSWDWSKVNYNRLAVVNLLIQQIGRTDTKYLEIGCAGNILFDAIACNCKVGVDPETGGTLRQTSDEFFSKNTQTFDVIFIDGLHEFRQVHRDAVNAISCLNIGGWIAFHDFLPRNWKEQFVPRLQLGWTGDCWKLAYELSLSPSLDFKIVNVDHGVGVVRLKAKDGEIVDMRDELQDKGFDFYCEILEGLPRIDWKEATDWIMNQGSAC